nr:hypothetical protein [Mycoplasmopsis bovis]
MSVFEGGDLIFRRATINILDNWLLNKEQKESTNAILESLQLVDDYKKISAKEYWSKSQQVIRNQKKQGILLLAYVYFQFTD